MARNKFIDPKTGETYNWPMNHQEEESVVRDRVIERLEPVAAGWQPVEPIRQQGTSALLVMRLRGVVVTAAMHATFLRFWRLCDRQSIHFVHFDGTAREVLLKSYEPQRKHVIRGVLGGVREKNQWTYSMELEVLANR